MKWWISSEINARKYMNVFTNYIWHSEFLFGCGLYTICLGLMDLKFVSSGFGDPELKLFWYLARSSFYFMTCEHNQPSSQSSKVWSILLLWLRLYSAQWKFFISITSSTALDFLLIFSKWFLHFSFFPFLFFFPALFLRLFFLQSIMNSNGSSFSSNCNFLILYLSS